MLAVALVVVGLSAGWIPAAPQTSALATQIVLAALAGIYALARTWLKTNAPADLPPGVQSAIANVVSAMAAPSPPPTATATERKPEAGRVSLPVASGFACLALSMAIMVASHGCSGTQKPGQPTIGGAAGSALACTEAELTTAIGNRPLLAVIAEDLLSANYQAAIDALIAQVGEPLVRCAISFVDDIGGAIFGNLVIVTGGSDELARTTIKQRAHAIRTTRGW